MRRTFMELAIAVTVVLPVVVFAVQLYCYNQYYKARHTAVSTVKTEVAAGLC
jgi:hypothetical protein